MKSFIDGEEFERKLTFLESASAKNAGSPRRADDMKILLIDLVNPQPKSAKSFYSRISPMTPKSPRGPSSGRPARVRRNSKKKL